MHHPVTHKPEECGQGRREEIEEGSKQADRMRDSSMQILGCQMQSESSQCFPPLMKSKNIKWRWNEQRFRDCCLEVSALISVDWELDCQWSEVEKER